MFVKQINFRVIQIILTRTPPMSPNIELKEFKILSCSMLIKCNQINENPVWRVALSHLNWIFIQSRMRMCRLFELYESEAVR